MSGVVEARLYRKRDVLERTTLSERSLRRLIAAGKFPKPIAVTIGRLAWPQEAVESWIRSKVAAGVHRCDDE